MATTTMAVPFLLYQWSTHPGTSAPSLLASYLRDLSLMHATTWSAKSFLSFFMAKPHSWGVSP
eukprot:scaffold228607_cov14-Tisochrysis_lutea.AAC.1